MPNTAESDHIVQPQVGDWWFIRVRGSTALQRIKVLARFDYRVWQLMEVQGGMADRQEIVDFEFVTAFPKDTIVGERLMA